jgi:hypothetical protein
VGLGVYVCVCHQRLCKLRRLRRSWRDTRSASSHQPANRTGCAGAAVGLCTFSFLLVDANLLCDGGCVIARFGVYVCSWRDTRSASSRQLANRTGCAGAAVGLCTFSFLPVDAELFCDCGSVVAGCGVYVCACHQPFVHGASVSRYCSGHVHVAICTQHQLQHTRIILSHQPSRQTRQLRLFHARLAVVACMAQGGVESLMLSVCPLCLQCAAAYTHPFVTSAHTQDSCACCMPG